MYEILLERQAETDLKKLPTAYFQRVIHKLTALKQEPRPQGCRKIVGSDSDYRVRIGDYRIVYEIDDDAQTVRVMRVKHRREAYR